MRDAEGSPAFTLADIDPNRFQVLIVDELHRLRRDVQDRIVRIAAYFEHVLILTATPAFQHADRHAQLFALLEPERAAIARSRIAAQEKGKRSELAIGEDLSKWPRWATAAVVDELLERDRVAVKAVEAESITATALTHCAYRRVIRTRRVDYSGSAPSSPAPATRRRASWGGVRAAVLDVAVLWPLGRTQPALRSSIAGQTRRPQSTVTGAARRFLSASRT